MDSKFNLRSAVPGQAARARTIRTAVIAGLLMLCLAILSFGQERTITGRVTAADDGSPLPGVNVVIKGTNTGTNTDNDGKYQLVIGNSASLVFSFVGFTSQEIVPGERTTVDVSLAQDARQLEEIVVTGTGVPTEKRKLAFAVESINDEKLPPVPTASIDQALIGKIPGALILSGNGQPGADISILLRGINSVNRGTQPMILVNGVEMGVSGLNSLDLSNIERVEVVQGAASASIYGAQGANGVIQIFTKQGTPGRLDIDITSSVSNNEWLNVGGLAKADKHGFKTNSNNEVIGNSGNPLVQDPDNLTYSENVEINLLDPTVTFDKPYDQNLRYHDHFEEFYQAANTYNFGLRISGGSQYLDFSFAASNNHQENNFKGDGFNNRTSLYTDLRFKITPKLTLTSSTQLAYTTNTVNLLNKQGFGTNGLVFGIMNTRPFVDYYAADTEGNPGIHFGDAAGVNSYSPLYTYRYSDTDDETTDLLQSFQILYQPFRFLDLNVKYGLNIRSQNILYEAANQTGNNNSDYTGWWEYWYNGSDPEGEYSTFDYDRNFQNLLVSATANLDFERDFHLGIPLKSITQVSYDYRSRNRHDYIVSALGLPLAPPVTADQATSYKVQQDYREEFLTYGFLVNQRFEWAEAAGISAGFRSDYSSAFGKGSDPFTFPRADGFLRISGLRFWDGTAISRSLLEWKLRAAYGQAGIQPNAYDRFPTLSTRVLGSTNAYYLGATQANPDLEVEVSTEFEAGTDLTLEGLKGNWLKNTTLSFTYWQRSTDNAIWIIDAPPSSGVGNTLDNAFSIRSNGIQASLTEAVLRAGKFRWDLTANLGRQTSIVESITGDTEVVVGSYVLKAGEKVGQLYGYRMLNTISEINPTTGQPFIDPGLQGNYTVASNGYVVDKARKVPYVTTEKFALGDPFPDFNASFINDFAFGKSVRFGFQLDWIKGGNIYNQTKGWMYRDGIHSDFTKPITIEGESGAWSAFYNGAYTEVTRNGVKSYFYEDGSFARLRNAYLSYDFTQLLNRKFRKLELILAGRNLLTWTKYTGMDPELSSFNPSGVLAQRWDHNVLPNFRSYQLTLNVGF
jgi:TonB-linked SusC/RagA family outer membrane protein